MHVEKRAEEINLLNYEKPTDEEVTLVVNFWAYLQAQFASGAAFNADGSFNKYTPVPSGELLQRVAMHQQWQQAMACRHIEIRMTYDEPLTCAECNRPLQIMSDVQIQDAKEK